MSTVTDLVEGGTRETLSPIFISFMQFSAKIMRNMLVPTPLGLAALWGVLDPLLMTRSQYMEIVTAITLLRQSAITHKEASAI